MSGRGNRCRTKIKGLALAGLDRAVINFTVDRLENENAKIIGVRAAFQEGKPAFENSALFSRSHVQIAVRDPSVIKQIWLENKI